MVLYEMKTGINPYSAKSLRNELGEGPETQADFDLISHFAKVAVFSEYNDRKEAALNGLRLNFEHPTDVQFIRRGGKRPFTKVYLNPVGTGISLFVGDYPKPESELEVIPEEREIWKELGVKIDMTAAQADV